MSETLTRDLRDVANENHAQEIKAATDAYVAALTSIRGANNPDGPALDLILACEAAAAKFKAMEDQMRAAPFRTMQGDGVVSFEYGGMVATVRAGSTSAQVTDMATLKKAAPELFVPQPDKLLQSELTKRLKAGMAVAGAQLSTGAPSLTIRRA